MHFTSKRDRSRLRLKLALFLIVLPKLALACARGELYIKVPPSFSVQITNDYGPVVALHLQLTHLRSEEYHNAVAPGPQKSPLDNTTDQMAVMTGTTPETTSGRRKKVDIKNYIDVIATAVTDSRGIARFRVKTPGSFMLETDNPGSTLGDITLVISKDASERSPVPFTWPDSAILQTRALQGRIESGLLWSTAVPLGNADLSLRELTSYHEVATATADDDGSFKFHSVPPGIYFLHVKSEGGGTYYDADGDIPIFLDAKAPRDSLSMAVTQTDCGLMYDLTENKEKYRPVACFRGGKQVPCTR